MNLMIGISTGMWVFSFKTMRSWRDFLFCGQCQAPPTQKTVQSPAIITSSRTPNVDPTQTRPLIPPARNPPPIPPPSHYMPLSVMTNSAGGKNIMTNTYVDSWKPSGVLWRIKLWKLGFHIKRVLLYVLLYVHTDKFLTVEKFTTKNNQIKTIVHEYKINTNKD